MNWLFYALLTVATWGLYGVYLHSGQMAMGDPINGRYKAFFFVGVAYFIIAVLAPLLVLKVNGSDFSFPAKGIWLSLFAGTLGAIGAFGVLLAFGAAPPIDGLTAFGTHGSVYARSVRDEHPLFRSAGLDELFVSKSVAVQADRSFQVLAESAEGPLVATLDRAETHVVYVAFDPLDFLGGQPVIGNYLQRGTLAAAALRRGDAQHAVGIHQELHFNLRYTRGHRRHTRPHFDGGDHGRHRWQRRGRADHGHYHA
jgi:hypothetical protein